MKSNQHTKVLLLLLAPLFAACESAPTTGTVPAVPRGLVVLDGYVQPGYTVLADSGSSAQRIPLGAPNEFDAGAFDLRNDTALAASSRGAGDLLYITDLNTAAVRRVQMPARSNPARARLLRGSSGRALIGVPLRDSASVLLFSIAPTGQATTERVADVGACPSDVFQHDGDLWVLDANASCATSYRALGGMRLIRIPAAGGARQTIPLSELRGSSAEVMVQGDAAYVVAGGDADFSSFPFALAASGAVARVDLKSRTVTAVRSMPVGSYGAGGYVGRDGVLYLSMYADLKDFASRVLALSLPTLAPTGSRVSGADWLALRGADGAAVACGSAQADGLGRVYCLETRAAGATFVRLFNPDGSPLREVAANQGGVDLRFR